MGQKQIWNGPSNHKQSKRMCGKRETQYFEAKTTNEQTEIKPHAVLD